MGNPLSGAVPVWVYIVIAVLGVALTAMFVVLHIRTSRRPGPTRGDLGLPFAGAVMSFFVLVAAPLALLAMGGAGARDPRNSIMMVEFSGDGVDYQGEYRPTGGTGPMRVIFTDPEDGKTRRVEQQCTMLGSEGEITIECRDARDFTGGSYSSDRFVVRFEGDRATGSAFDPTGTRLPATFRFVTSREPRFADVGFTSDSSGSLATPAPSQPSVSAPPAANSGLAAELDTAVEQLRQQLPIRSGPATVTAVEAVGTQLVTYMTVAVDLQPAQWSELDRGLRQNACKGSSLNLINSGASANYQLQDSASEQRTIIISSCP